MDVLVQTYLATIPLPHLLGLQAGSQGRSPSLQRSPRLWATLVSRTMNVRYKSFFSFNFLLSSLAAPPPKRLFAEELGLRKVRTVRKCPMSPNFSLALASDEPSCRNPSSPTASTVVHPILLCIHVQFQLPLLRRLCQFLDVVYSALSSAIPSKKRSRGL